jgi:hypothetical protein
MREALALAIAVVLVSATAWADPPKALIDDQWVVEAKAQRAPTFWINGGQPVEIRVEGVQDAMKGFTVYVVPGQLWRDFVAKKATRKAFADYPTAKVRDPLYKQTLALGRGDWAVVVWNSENVPHGGSISATSALMASSHHQ